MVLMKFEIFSRMHKTLLLFCAKHCRRLAMLLWQITPQSNLSFIGYIKLAEVQFYIAYRKITIKAAAVIVILGSAEGTSATQLCYAKYSVLHLCWRGGCERVLLPLHKQHSFTDGKITKGCRLPIYGRRYPCSNLWSRQRCNPSQGRLLIKPIFEHHIVNYITLRKKPCVKSSNTNSK